MIGAKDRLSLLFGGCTAFLWRYAWINYITLASCERTFPSGWALVFFWLSFVLTGLYAERGLRIITVGLIHITGFSLAALGTLHTLYAVEVPILRLSWIVTFFSRARTPTEGLLIALLLIMPILFWAGGTLLAVKGKSHKAHCARLDIGIAFFFLLFLTKFFLRIRGGTVVPDPLSMKLFYPFLIFGTAGIALSKNKGSVEREFLEKHRGTGLVLTFTMILLAGVTGFTLLFMPLLHAAAETGFGIIKTISRPLGAALVRLLRFLFSSSRARPAAGNAGGELDEPGFLIPVMLGEETLYHLILRYILIGIIVAISMFLIAVLLRLLIDRLFSRTSNTRKKPPLTLAGIISLLAARLRRLFRRTPGREGEIRELYRSLLRWGYRGGMGHRKNETPEEYRLRLSAVYPFGVDDITRITDMFSRSCYGCNAIPAPELSEGYRALRRLKNPAFMFTRVRVWLGR